MIGKISVVILSVVCLWQINQTSGHGRLLDPIARTSAWRKWPGMFPAEYTDNQMFCGGVDKQWNRNGGKCGICGEDYSGPKSFEKGGANYRDLIVAKYTAGQQMEAVVQVTANHYGYFQFSLCNVDHQRGEATQECLDRNVLSDLHGQKHIYIERGKTGTMKFQLKLPAGFRCNHCVFQWKYNSGNSWGVDRMTGESGLGKGPQEQFYGCSDVQIKGSKREFIDEYSNAAPQSSGTVQVYKNTENGSGQTEIAVLDKLIEYHVNRLSELFKKRKQLGSDRS